MARTPRRKSRTLTMRDEDWENLTVLAHLMQRSRTDLVTRLTDDRLSKFSRQEIDAAREQVRSADHA